MGKYLEMKYTPITNGKKINRKHHFITLILLLLIIIMLGFIVYKVWTLEKTSLDQYSSHSQNPIINTANLDALEYQDTIKTIGLAAGHSYPIDSTYEFVNRSLFETSLDNVKGYYGVDVSHWQQKINWKKVVKDTLPSRFDFFIIKATQGEKYVDPKFEENWKNAQKVNNFIGAYHFFIFKDDPIIQANNYCSNVPLKKGNIIPILDIEYDCSGCKSLGISKEKAIENLKIFTNEIEAYYKVKPLLYTNESFFNQYLKGSFDSHLFWIAKYSKTPPEQMNFSNQINTEKPRVVMWQFTDHESVTGISNKTDASFLLEQYLDDIIFNK